MDPTNWVEKLAEAIFSQAGLVALLLFAALVWMAYRENALLKRNQALQDKMMELTVLTNSTLDKHAMLLDSIKDRLSAPR